jgi:hypothetical protein
MCRNNNLAYILYDRFSYICLKFHLYILCGTDFVSGRPPRSAAGCGHFAHARTMVMYVPNGHGGD